MERFKRADSAYVPVEVDIVFDSTPLAKFVAVTVAFGATPFNVLTEWSLLERARARQE